MTDESCISDMELKQYDDAARLWQSLYSLLMDSLGETIKYFRVKQKQDDNDLSSLYSDDDDDDQLGDEEELPLMLPDKSGSVKESVVKRYFWGGELFFLYMCLYRSIYIYIHILMYTYVYIY